VYQQRVDKDLLFKCHMQEQDLHAVLQSLGQNIVQMKVRNYFLSNILDWKIEDVAKDDNVIGKGTFGRVFKVNSSGGYLAVKMIEYKNKNKFFHNLHASLNEVFVILPAARL
jgi:hypothetical protein